MKILRLFLVALILLGAVSCIKDARRKSKLLPYVSFNINDAYDDVELHQERGYTFAKIGDEERFEVVVADSLLDILSQDSIRYFIIGLTQMDDFKQFFSTFPYFNFEEIERLNFIDYPQVMATYRDSQAKVKYATVDTNLVLED